MSSLIRVIVFLFLLLPASNFPGLAFASVQVPEMGLSAPQASNHVQALDYAKTLNHTETSSANPAPEGCFSQTDSHKDYGLHERECCCCQVC